MANIRDQCSWVHQDFPQAATEKAKDLVRMSVAKANRISPLAENSVSVTPRALIIGGGLAGMTAALNLARQGFSSHLVEKEDQLGGQARHIRETWKGEDVQAFLEKLIKEVMSEKKITVHLKSEVIGVEGFVGNFKSLLSTEEVIEHGVTILATGAEPSSTAEYLYGHNPKVTLWHELDDFLAKNPDSAKSWKSAVFILCTGSRTPERPYCSRICCTSTLHRALRLKESNPTMEVFILFRDIRTYGQREDLFRQAREKGILFIRYDLENKPKVEAVNGKLQITVTDPIVGLPLVMEPDIVNLATAIIPRDNDGLARRFKVPMNSEKFFVEAHIKLRPVDFATEGIFLCGMAHYPKPIDEAITQALAAASRAATVLSQKSIRTGGVVALINPETCIGCQSCLKVCSYEAITYDPSAHICVVNSALCKGCGACAATCPSGSAQLMGFGSRQLFSMIDQAIGF
jgi:heterodisulfide reductase subunit A